jgi:hypothetical protein
LLLPSHHTIYLTEGETDGITGVSMGVEIPGETFDEEEEYSEEEKKTLLKYGLDIEAERRLMQREPTELTHDLRAKLGAEKPRKRLYKAIGRAFGRRPLCVLILFSRSRCKNLANRVARRKHQRSVPDCQDQCSHRPS